MSSQSATAAKLTGISVLDCDHITVGFSEGEVKFPEGGETPPAPGEGVFVSDKNWIESYGPLNVEAATEPGTWTIISVDDPAYGSEGRHPEAVFRKSKITGMAELEWDTPNHDWHYEAPLGHEMYLKLPSPLREGARYQLVIGGKLGVGEEPREFVFDVFESRSEAIHLNLVGYMDDGLEKSADVYYWLGDGGPRDYSSFEGAKVFVRNLTSGEKREAGRLRLGRKPADDVGWHKLIVSDVWLTTFDLDASPGPYRIAIDGIGCSQDFMVGRTIYEVPFKVSVKGFYYMRIGEPERPDIRPIPRQPRYIPGEDPASTRIKITTMTPYHPEWKTFAPGDKWDRTKEWERFMKDGSPENPNARGGHADALDWDRHLGHVSIIYDMLLPYILTDGAIGDDDTGIAESGNGAPDILDEARNEVDFWLSVRDGEGYGHGLTNPNGDNVFYQAGTTTVAAWANAANAAMLADCYRIAGLEELKNRYLNHAVTAYEYAGKQPDQQLETVQNVGGPAMRGADFKITAAAFLFNLTGEEKYEDVVKELSLATSRKADVISKQGCQIWATAGYLLSPRKTRHWLLKWRMKRSVIINAFKREAGHVEKRPSRRATNHEDGYFHTCQNVHRTLLAHRICGSKRLRKKLLSALVLEADWGLGRNPMNMIQMTTATTPLADKRSVENAYTSGRNDGTPGLHPGHTPYMNMDDWGGEKGMIMARPRWMAAKGYPEFEKWPRGECHFNTRWVWAHAEFTPQQTMRGKMALYGYLYGMGKRGR